MAASKAGRKTLTFVTGNPKKLEEVKAILGESLGWTLTSRDVDLPELQGEPEDIARDKCLLASERVEGAVMTEDTCLCYNALGGLPGPYIKWFLKKTGHEGLNNLLAAYSDKTAFAQCTFAFCEGKGHPVKLFKGITNGTIVAARGPPDFGWDPIFQPQGFSLTYAEMESEVKNSISHRYKALCALRDYLTGQTEEGEGGEERGGGEEGDNQAKRPKLD